MQLITKCRHLAIIHRRRLRLIEMIIKKQYGIKLMRIVWAKSTRACAFHLNTPLSFPLLSKWPLCNVCCYIIARAQGKVELRLKCSIGGYTVWPL